MIIKCLSKNSSHAANIWAYICLLLPWKIRRVDLFVIHSLVTGVALFLSCQSLFFFNHLQLRILGDARGVYIFISSLHSHLPGQYNQNRTICVRAQSCLTLCRPRWTISTRLLCPQDLSRQEYWSGLQFPPPGDLPDTGMKFTSPTTPALQADSLPLSHLGSQKYTMFHLINLSCQNFQELAQ